MSGRVQLVIDGVTGVGKSSLAKILADELNLKVYEEIFEDKNQLLYKFFQDRERWCFPMQVNFLSNRFRQFREASSLGRVILDRSIYSDRIFALMYREAGYLTPEEYDVYNNVYENMLAHVTPPALIIYLRAGVGEIIRRIRLRGRPEELEVEPAYWARLHNFYEEHYASTGQENVLAVEVDGLDYVHREADRKWLVELIKERHRRAMAAE